MRPSTAILDRLRAELRLVPRVRLGTVKKVDTSGPVDIVTLETGTRCRTPYALAVDDSVVWLSGPLPVILFKPYSTP